MPRSLFTFIILILSGCTATANQSPPPASPTFQLVAEWSGPCEKSTDPIDVNLGNSPETFVRAAYCQVVGTEPDAATIALWSNRLKTSPNLVRRIDVVRTFCPNCALKYSNPWLSQIEHTGSCVKKSQRDLGAVMMFFFDCPGKTNCTMDWANSHALAMDKPDPIYGGYYRPDNSGFWYRELLDARYAGLQFLLPNVYGPDVQSSAGAVQALQAALTVIGSGIQVGLFMDTWAWGKPYWGNLMQPIPDLSQVDEAANRIYRTEWKPFFSGIDPRHWYRVKGQPLIYFYNGGTLKPGAQIPAVVEKMKELFLADFGVAPYVVLDSGYGVANPSGVFNWYTLGIPDYVSQSTSNSGVKLANFMTKWDSTGRDFPGRIYSADLNPNRPMHKGPEILEQALENSKAADIAVIATWNDLGEGTGINRNYDYYYQGQWLAPDYFMKITRAAQCQQF
jgi:hypothetical protein